MSSPIQTPETSQSDANIEPHDDDLPEEVESWTNDDHVYAAQYFNYTPKAFSDGMYNGFIDYVKEGLTMIQEQMISEFKKYLTPADAEQATDKLMSGMVPVVAKAFDRFEMFVSSNTFRIPDNVILREDAVQMENHGSLDDQKKLSEEISELETQIMNARYMNAVLRQRLREVDAHCKLGREMETMIKSIGEPPKDAGLLGTVSDSVEFVRSQIASVESTVENIKSMESQLAAESGDTEACRKRSGSRESEQAKKITRNS